MPGAAAASSIDRPAGSTAVHRQRAELGVDQVVARSQNVADEAIGEAASETAVADQVVPAAGEVTRDVWVGPTEADLVQGGNRVLDTEDATGNLEETTAEATGHVLDDRVGQCRCDRVDATAFAAGGVAADGAVGQCGRVSLARLSLTVQLVSVAVLAKMPLIHRSTSFGRGLTTGVN